VGSATLLLDPGTVVFYPAWMEYRVSHPVPGGDRSLVVALSEEAFESLRIRRLHEGHAVYCRHAALDIRRVDHAAREGASLAIEELLVRLVREALEALTRPRREDRGREGTAAARRQAVERAREIMAARYGERLTLDDIAGDSGYSVPHLCEVFRQEIGMTIHRYLSQLRLVIALEGLDGAPNMTRLAYEVGFSTPSHFATAFRREFGHPPSRLLPAIAAGDVARLRP
jgi:AraC-like DNA-binding protein